MKEVNIRPAVSETLFIIKNLEKSLYDKIPVPFLKSLEKMADDEYYVSIDLEKNINEQELLPETRVFLALIYRDYLCSKEEKKILIDKDNNYFKEKYEKLNNVFKNVNVDIQKTTNNNINNTEIEEKSLVIKKENVIIKIINLIKKIFTK